MRAHSARESRESREVRRGTGQRLVDRTTVASALHSQLWCDARRAAAAAVAQMLICSCTACDHARRRAVIIRCTRGLVDDGTSLSCVAHSTPLASPEWERDGGAEAAVRTESEAAHWLPCAPGFHALAALALHRGRLFRGRSLSFKRCLRESTFCALCKHFFRRLSFLPLPKPKRLPSHPTSRWGGEEHFGYKLTM